MTPLLKRTGAFCAAFTLCLATAPALAHDAMEPAGGAGFRTTDLPPLRADGHAPIGVMGDHLHKTGEVMLSYRFMHMDMGGYGGETVTLFAGVNLVAQRGALRGHRLALEIGAPVYQDVNGLQLETDWVATLGWQRAF